MCFPSKSLVTWGVAQTLHFSVWHVIEEPGKTFQTVKGGGPW